MKVFKTSSWGERIVEREIIEMTDKSIFYLNNNGNKKRDAIHAKYSSHFKTRDEALSFLRKQHEDKIERLQRQIKNEQDLLNELK